MRNTFTLLAGLGLALLVAFATDKPQTQNGPSQHSLKAVQALRLIATAEIHTRHDAGRYVPFAELVKTDALKRASEIPRDKFGGIYNELNLQNAAEPLPGFVLALVVAPDGNAYKISLHDKAQCGLALFSDENGIVYQGRAVGCEGK